MEQHFFSYIGDPFSSKLVLVSFCSELSEVGVVLEGRTIELGKPLGGGKREWGGGGQFTSNLGPGWMRIAPHRKEGFQVSKRPRVQRGIGKGS